MIRLARGLALLVLSGCAPLALNHPDLPGHELRSLPLPPVHELDEPKPTPGSLWRGEISRRFLSFEKRARQPGDLITVQILEQAKANSEANTKLDRTSSLAATLNSDIGLQTLVSHPVLSVLRFFGFSKQPDNKTPTQSLDIVDADTTAKFDGKGTVERESNLRTTLACLVTQVLPSGLLRIEGQRYITINGETQQIRLTGYVRPEDVQIDNTVSSSLVASAEIEYGGQGEASDQQRTPWLMHILGKILPF